MTGLHGNCLYTKTITRRLLFLSLILLLGAVTAISTWYRRSKPIDLRPLVAARFPDMPWIGTEELAKRMESGEGNILLLDSRTQEEYQVSHLEGALRIEPGTTECRDGVLESTAVIVVYCSVGYRSAAVVDALRKAGRNEVFNLDGGIFQWANESRPLFSGHEQVQLVHPYDRSWGRLLKSELRATVL